MSRARTSAWRPVLLGSVLVWTLLPLLPLVLWAWSGGWSWPALLPERWSARAWSYLLAPTTRTLSALGSSITVAGCVAVLSLLLGVPAAISLSRYAGRARAIAESVLLAPLIVPPLGVAMALQVALIRLGLADTLAGVVLVHLVFALPYVVLIVGGAARSLDPGWEAQARSLGASPLQEALHVSLPLLWPALVVGALLAFLVSWSQYSLTLLIGGGRIWTLPLLVFAAARGSDTALLAAAALLLLAPALLALGLTARLLDRRGMAFL